MKNLFSSLSQNKIQEENDTTIIKFFNKENNEEIGSINYSLCPPADNNDLEIIKDDEMGIRENTRNKILNVMKEKNKHHIHINFITIEKKYRGYGGSYFILNKFITNLEKCGINNFYITLSDDTDKIKDSESFWEKLGAVIYTTDDEAIIYDTDFFINKLNEKMNRNKKITISNSGLNCKESCNKKRKKVGGKIEYIMTKKGKRKIHIGKRGGKYYIMNKKRVYIK